jgi:hypothetical protein
LHYLRKRERLGRVDDNSNVRKFEQRRFLHLYFSGEIKKDASLPWEYYSTFLVKNEDNGLNQKLIISESHSTTNYDDRRWLLKEPWVGVHRQPQREQSTQKTIQLKTFASFFVDLMSLTFPWHGVPITKDLSYIRKEHIIPSGEYVLEQY